MIGKIRQQQQPANSYAQTFHSAFCSMEADMPRQPNDPYKLPQIIPGILDNTTLLVNTKIWDSIRNGPLKMTMPLRWEMISPWDKCEHRVVPIMIGKIRQRHQPANSYTQTFRSAFAR